MKRVMCVACVMCAGGCVMPQNDRITLGQKLVSPSLQAAPLAQAEPPPAQVVMPSVTGIDRSDWARTEVFLPVDGTVHGPTYTHRWQLADKTARQRGQYPTALTALELYNGSQGDQQLEALLNPLQSLGDIVLFPIKIVILEPFWRTRMSPDIAYDRTVRPEQLPPEPSTQPTTPFAQPAPVSVTP